jgi:hypothetical protein
VPLVQKATVDACFIKELHFYAIFALRWQEAIFIEARFLLDSAKALPTLCVKASAQKALRAKVQKCFKIKGVF